jgi:hypothetical protein
VTGEQGADQKLEPHLEEQAENYCAPCYQENNIVPFLESDERYLFLFTTCRNGDPERDGQRYIVGYLDKERAIDRSGHFAVQGDISLYSFDEAYPLGELHDSPEKIRMLKTDREETAAILEHLGEGTNRFEDCLARTLELEKQIGRSSGAGGGCSSTCGCGHSSRTSDEISCGCERETKDNGGC